MLNYSYPCFCSDTLNVIEKDIDIIGREEELKIIDKNYKNILESKINYKVIGFNGDNGSGKTKLLDEIKYILENKYFNSVMYIDNLICKTNEETYENIIEYIKEKCDKQLYDKYDIYIRKFISICLQSDKEDESKYGNNQRLQLINRVGKFIREYTNLNPLVLMIDDLINKSTGLKEFIRYISFLGNSLENIMIVLSLNENNCDESFFQYIQNFKTLSQYEEYRINLFNQYDTTKMIKNILNTNKPIGNLSTKIYSETLGNPQYIYEVIDELYNNNILYFDEEKLKWKTSVKVKDILIPKILEEKLETSISSLNEDEIEVLKMLSIYEISLPESVIFGSILTDDYNIQIYKKLKSKGYIIDKISDQGMLVGFSNYLVRNLLNLKLDKEKKKEMHKKAYELLKRTLSVTDYYIEEILFHLEECNEFEILCSYLINYVKDLEKNNYFEKAIVYY